MCIYKKVVLLQSNNIWIMKVDVLLISYNQSQFVRQAIENIIVQQVVHINGEKPQVRVIVADDASTDNTLTIIKSFEKESPFPFIYLPNENNLGHVMNYKRAFAACQGDYVCVLEADDWWSSPLHIQKHIQFLEEHKECAMSVNRLAEYYPDEKLFSIPTNKYDKIMYYDVRDQILENMISNHSSACYRTELLHQLPDEIFDRTFDDWLLGIFMCQFGFIVQLPEVTSVYRVHQGGIYSGATEEDNIKLRNERFDKALELFGDVYGKKIEFAKKMFNAKKKKKSLRDYFPPFLYDLYRLLIPQALRQIIK